MAHTCGLLDEARAFHDTIAATYHDRTFAHYGADEDRPSWEHITWHLNRNVRNSDWRKLLIASDSKQGELVLKAHVSPSGQDAEMVTASLAHAQGAGDETVPLRSADHQMQSGKLLGIFKQSGYEHQSSYDDKQVLNATLYCILRIAQTMKRRK